MDQDQPFYRAFLGELKALDDFLLRRHGDLAYVERADPDVRRLMEAVAFFATRSRHMATQGFDAAISRLARAHLEPLLRPQPARALIQAVPGDRLVEPVSLPQGTLVRVVAPDREVGLFRTMHSATLLPLAVQRARLSLRPGRGYRLLIGLSARTPLRALGRPLGVHIDYLGDYPASQQLLHQLRAHLDQATVVYGDEPEATATGLACPVSFGAPAPLDTDTRRHPLDELASFFHFPEQDLYLHVDLPVPERPWRRAWLCLDLDEGWPTELVVNKDVFRLFVIPVENARPDLAEPILCDGTRSSYPLRPPAPHSQDVLCSVIGVYQETADGREPLLPEHLSPAQPEAAPAYELERMAGDGDGDGAAHHLLVRIPGAFEEPRKLSVEALWYQPAFDAHAVGRLDVSLQTRHIEGARWQMQGTVRGHRTSRLQGKPFELMHLVALGSKPVLTRDEILYVLRLCGADQASSYGELAERITAVSVSERRTKDSGRLEYVYHVMARDISDDTRPMMSEYLSRMQRLLDCWTSSPVVVTEELGEMGAPPKAAGMAR